MPPDPPAAQSAGDPPPCPRFGTDGIRGLAGEAITPELMYHLGLCAAAQLAPGGDGFLLVGRDGRDGGEQLQAAFMTGVKHGGLQMMDCGVVPSGLLALYCGAAWKKAAAAVITASHNPNEYNGIKFYGSIGAKLSRKTEQALLERWPGAPAPPEKQSLSEWPRRWEALLGTAVKRLRHYGGKDRPLKGLKILVDCARGAARDFAEPLLAELGARAERIDGPGKINENCGAGHPQALAEAVAAGDWDCGIALDGDGDRLVLCDRSGRLLDGDDLLLIWAFLRHPKGLAGTLMTNGGVEVALRNKRIQFARSEVGEVPLLALMRERGWDIGGEPSGHLLNLNLHPAADGLINAVALLSDLRAASAEPAEVLRSMRYEPFAQIQAALPCPDPQCLELPGPQDCIADFQTRVAQADPDGRLLVRPSGTEPVVRLMVETREEKLSRELLDDLSFALETELRAVAGKS